MINLLATIEKRPEDGMDIVNVGHMDDSWTPFWLLMPHMPASKQAMFDAVGEVLKRAMAHFKVEKLADLEMAEIRGIRIIQPNRPDGTRFDDYVIHIRKKVSVQ